MTVHSIKPYALLATAFLCIAVPAFAQTPPPPPATSAPLPLPASATTAAVPFPASAAPASAAAPVPAPATPAKAVDIEQQIRQALEEYKENQYGKAAKTLETASTQLRKMKGAALSAFLPAAPQGWAVKDQQALDLSSIVLRGSVAERIYTSGGEEVTVSIAADSSIMASMYKMKQQMGASMLKFMGYDYIFNIKDPIFPASQMKNRAVLFVNSKLSISVLGNNLTDQQAQGFLGLIDLTKLTTEADK